MTRVRNQQTLENPTVVLEGAGLYSGNKVMVCIAPAAVGTGIRFVQGEAKTPLYAVQASFGLVDSARSVGYTILSNAQGQSVQTPEHFMAALAGLGIDNAVVHFVTETGTAPQGGFELPLLDGGSATVVEAILQAGIVEQGAPKKTIRILKPVRVDGGQGRYVELRPHDGQSLVVDFTGNYLGAGGMIEEKMRFDTGVASAFARDIAWARTFTTYSMALKLLQIRPNIGADGDNVLIIDDRADSATYGQPYVGMIGQHHYQGAYKKGLKTERARHKILDAIGDIALSELDIVGELVSVNGGHALNNEVLRALFQQGEGTAFEYVESTKAATTSSLPLARKHLVEAAVRC